MPWELWGHPPLTTPQSLGVSNEDCSPPWALLGQPTFTLHIWMHIFQ